jgi:hypothetical protein
MSQERNAESFRRFLADKIYALGLRQHFKIRGKTITSCLGSEFLFKGLSHSIQEIKSLQVSTLLGSKKRRGFLMSRANSSFRHCGFRRRQRFTLISRRKISLMRVR